MVEIQRIFGIKESKQNFISPERQSIEQTEDYSVKKVIHVQELYITKLFLDKVSNTYFQYNSATDEVDLYVSGVIRASF